jgi:hypothetical protein
MEDLTVGGVGRRSKSAILEKYQTAPRGRQRMLRLDLLRRRTWLVASLGLALGWGEAAAGVYTPLGTQGPLTFAILPPGDCFSCHADYDAAHIEPWDTWAGSMMANAVRDPIFWAALDVANHDGAELGFEGVGEFCLRCHAPTGWLEGRANAGSGINPVGDADGCALAGSLDATDNDFSGITCHFCHRMQINGSPPVGQDAVYFENASFWIDDQICASTMPHPQAPCRAGPYDYDGLPNHSLPLHEWSYSAYEVDNDLCGNCHNVTSPLHNLKDESGQDTGVPFPIERTFKEWQQSTLGDRTSPQFENCSACHMPDTTQDPVCASSQCRNNRSGDMPLHQLAGGNTWIPSILEGEYGASLDRDPSFEATVGWALELLQNRSASLEMTLPPEIAAGGDLVVDLRVTNLTGHKLPTGYGEGRRMWIQLVVRDGADEVIWESGSWSSASGELSADDQLRVYEVQQGIWNFNGSGQCDVESVASGRHLFHFVKNDCVALDNRIPPLGFSGADDLETRPVGYSYPETAPGSGVLVNYDSVSYQVPVPEGTPSPVTVEATLRYQTASDEYIEFLRDQAVDHGFADDCIPGSGAQLLGTSRGEYLYTLWNDPAYGRSPPVDLAHASGSALVIEEIFADGFESGDTGSWSSATP